MLDKSIESLWRKGVKVVYNFKNEFLIQICTDDF